MQQKEQVLRLLQITDSHLRREADGVLLGMNTRESLDAVLALAMQQHPNPDLVLATGDIAQDGTPEAYRCFEQKMQAFTCPVVWFAGNHDDRANMATVIADTPAQTRRVQAAGWQLIFLDSSEPGKVYGKLDQSELDFLDDCLQECPHLHALVCFHHHPVDIQCQWLANIGLRNASALLAIVDKHPQVKGILWGHIHQEYDGYHGQVRLLASPSTCVQFEPLTQDFSVDRKAPGYRWLELHADGRIETGVVRAEHIAFEVDLNSQGY